MVNKKREYIFYISLFACFILGLGLVFYFASQGLGFSLSLNPQNNSAGSSDSSFLIFQKEIKKNISNPLSLVLFQTAIILVLARIFSRIVRIFGQPSVIGEIIAGIALGPSFVGYFFPELTSVIFPKESLGNLQLLSQIGLILFMFIIGMELDVSLLKHNASSALIISHASIVFPFLLGTILSLYLFPRFAPQGVSFVSFSLFMGIAMSITAFPVLARILHERNLTKTRIGLMAISAAAVDDISAWCLLALIVALAQAGKVGTAGYILFFSVLFVLFMVYIIRPVLNKMSKVYITREIISRGVVSILLLIMIGSSFLTAGLGIHALFGAFLAGVIMPSNTKLRAVLTEKFQDFSTVFLLPLFFAFTGLRTKISLLNDFSLIGSAILVIIIAIIGKLGGGVVAARFSGMTWKESFSLGALLNTRGLMELIVLNIGYDLGILSPTIFVMMVIMALLTTFMTGPLLNFINKGEVEEKPEVEKVQVQTKGDILITYGPPEAGISLLKIASLISGPGSTISALHLSPIPEDIGFVNNSYQLSNFESLIKTANENRVKIETIFKMSNDIPADIVDTINRENSSLVLMGAAQRVFGGNIFGGKVEAVLNQVNCNVGVFLYKNFIDLKSILLCYSEKKETFDLFALISSITGFQKKEVTIIYDDIKPTDQIIKRYVQNNYKIEKINYLDGEISEGTVAFFGYEKWKEFELTDYYNKIQILGLPIIILRSNEGKV